MTRDDAREAAHRRLVELKDQGIKSVCMTDGEEPDTFLVKWHDTVPWRKPAYKERFPYEVETSEGSMTHKTKCPGCGSEEFYYRKKAAVYYEVTQIKDGCVTLGDLKDTEVYADRLRDDIFLRTLKCRSCGLTCSSENYADIHHLWGEELMTHTKRKPFTGSKAVDPTCRNRGRCRPPTCPCCRRNQRIAEAQQPSIFEELCSSCGMYLEPDGTCGACEKGKQCETK